MANEVQIGNELKVASSTYSPRIGLRFIDDGASHTDVQVVRYDTSGNFERVLATLDGSTGAFVPDASGVRTIAADGAFTIAASDRYVSISASTTVTVVITMTATYEGHILIIKMTAGDADSLYTAAVSGGTVTFNAANETAMLIYDGSAWRHLFLEGATFA